MKSKELLSIVTQLKQFGLLNNQIMSQAVSLLKDQVQILTTPELVVFSMIYTSPEARAAVNRDVNFDEKLDFILTKHVEQMTSEEFAQVCNSVLGDEQVMFSSFLKEGANLASNWLKENAFSLSDISSVVGAYSLILD
jgi:hypothetical protein